VGAAVITLPSHLMGSRATFTYYTIMGIVDLIARDKIECACRECSAHPSYYIHHSFYLDLAYNLDS
jgi:hypothetical protein